MTYQTEFYEGHNYLVEDMFSYKVAKCIKHGNIMWFNVGSYMLKATSCRVQHIGLHHNEK